MEPFERSLKEKGRKDLYGSHLTPRDLAKWTSRFRKIHLKSRSSTEETNQFVDLSPFPRGLL
jgi:hypothetical protein